MPPSMKTLKIRALKAENAYLNAKNQQLTERLETSKGLAEDYSKLAFSEKQYREAADTLRQNLDNAWSEIGEIAKFIPADAILPKQESRDRLMEHIERGEHIQAIKLLRSESPLSLGLKMAKTIYESKFRNYEKYPL